MRYEELDARILARIGEGDRVSCLQLSTCRSISAAAEELAESATPRTYAWRIIDARLQALRKAGKIEFVRGKESGWRLVA